MLFQSLQFGCFFLLVFLIYWGIPHKYRWCVILSAGYVFYACLDHRYPFVLLGITLLSYCVARMLERLEKHRRLVFGMFLGCEIGILVGLKYLNFFVGGGINALLRKASLTEIPIIEFLVPVGISFYLFQTMAYVIDVYERKVQTERHFGYYASCIAFFPILLSGPIERVQNLLPQFRQERKFSYEEACMALQWVLLGYFKKLIIADSLAVYVDRVYVAPREYSGFAVLLAILLYAVEIYCDFSGYSDIAIGVSGLLGISLKPNFARPYFATSVKEFWRRWHISLTSWFRDYVYIPLGGNRVAAWKKDRNVLITFLLSGLWHGAALTFVVWGTIHGLLQVAESRLQRHHFNRDVPAWMKRAFVFLLVSAAWVFFRADDLPAAWNILSGSVRGIMHPASYFDMEVFRFAYPKAQLGLLAFFMMTLYLYERWQEKEREKVLGVGVTVFMVFLSLFYYMRYGTDASAFIYFQF